MPALTLTANPSTNPLSNLFTNGSNTYSSNNVYASYTGTATTGAYVQVSGFGLSALPVGARINNIKYVVEGYASEVTRWQPPVIQAYISTTAIANTSYTLPSISTTDTSYTSTAISGITYADLTNANFGVRWTQDRSAGGSASTSFIDYIGIIIDYSIESWGSLYL